MIPILVANLFFRTENHAEASFVKTIDEVAEKAVADKKIVGTVIVAAKDGTIIYRKAHGLADRSYESRCSFSLGVHD